MTAADPQTYIFPLNTVLFPGGVLPLKTFEQRYIEMTKVCISEARPFGVCLIKEGRETGTPAVPQDIGCLARIVRWDMPQLGVFHLQVEGLQRFRILSSMVEKNGLISATIEHFPSPHRFDDAAWIGYRLSEVLPISLDLKQQMLRMTDPQARLSELGKILSAQGLLP